MFHNFIWNRILYVPFARLSTLLKEFEYSRVQNLVLFQFWKRKEDAGYTHSTFAERHSKKEIRLILEILIFGILIL